jgi:Flp pilus assembly protein TadD
MTNHPLQLVESACHAHALGEFAQAASLCKQALQIAPTYAEGWYNLGLACRGQGLKKQAVVAFKKAASLAIDNPDAQNSIGWQFIELDVNDEAEKCLKKALSLAPDFTFALSNLGILRRIQRRLGDAEVLFRKAIQCSPELTAAYINLGGILNASRQFEQAKQIAEKAVDLSPSSPEAWNNLSTTHFGLNDYSSAQETARKSVSLNPEFADAWFSLGIAFHQCGQLDDALASYNKTLDIDSAYADAHWNKSTLMLLKGNFSDGWPLYEWRWKRKESPPKRQFKQKLWLGQGSIDGKTLLLYVEQGIGDFLQFCRYALEAQKLGAKVILETPRPLIALTSTLSPEIKVVPQGDPLPKFDLQCPIMSLPLAFGTTVASIPGDTPYLFSSPARAQAWKAKLGTTSRLRVGLAWSGNPEHDQDRNRSLPAAMLAPLLEQDAEFFVVQKDVRPDDIDFLASHPEIHQYQGEFHDFSDTAALIDSLDLVISVDTSVAHLAGALGKPVWLLLQYIPDYRWLQDRTDTPWYPSARLFRQSSFGDWQAVIAKVAESLGDFSEAAQGRDQALPS